MEFQDFGERDWLNELIELLKPVGVLAPEN
jgi:hypothetical protein